jgi:integrase/recombinase XerD
MTIFLSKFFPTIFPIMATCLAILNTKYKSKSGNYPIIIRVIDVKRQKAQSIGYSVAESQFEAGQVINHPDQDIINSVIDEELLKAKRYVADCRIKNIPLDLSLVFQQVKSHSFTAYLQHRYIQHNKADEVEMGFKAKRFVKELNDCFGREIYFSEVNEDLLRQYDSWLKTVPKKPNQVNTRAKKFEFLGKYFNNAIDEGKAYGKNPFKSYHFSTVKPKVEKLSPAQFEALETLDISDSFVRLCRDLWLFSYYSKGARFAACITMLKTAIKGDRIEYRDKGYKRFSNLIHPKMRAIIDLYIDNPTDTIFGRVNGLDKLSKAQIRSKVGSENANVNRSLKTIGKELELPFPLTFHQSRHSLAYHLKMTTDNIHIIKETLGHSKTQTTEIYLKELDNSVVDAELDRLYKKAP